MDNKIINDTSNIEHFGQRDEIINNNVIRQIEKWLKWDKNIKTRIEIEDLINTKNWIKLEKILCKNMVFGTAGLRSVMGAGFACMNNLTVQLVSQAVCLYIEQCEPDIRQRGIVVGFDARHNSMDFARITAAVFLHHNIPVYLFRNNCATPLVPFVITTKCCALGIMITASHNPKSDNGYKVYWKNGSQIIPPHDTGIMTCIDINESPWSIDLTRCDTDPQCKDPNADGLIDKYYEQITQRLYTPNMINNNNKSKIKIVYTAMHGVGYQFATRMFNAFGFDIIPVIEQVEPNPDFPTVTYPNPEERGALDIAIHRGDEVGARLIIANDPDADRVAVAEKQPTGKWIQFTGDELGTALAVWRWNQWRDSHPDADPSKIAMLNSVVSSKNLKEIARCEGFFYDETLTGFKWLGNRTDELVKQGFNVLFAYEEAIGYMPCDLIRDKDGISTGAVVAEMALWLENNGKTIAQWLEELSQRYGIYVSNNGYFVCNDQKIITQIFTRLRNNGKYMNEVIYKNHKFKVSSIRDLKKPGFDNSTHDNKPILPLSSDSEMITYVFENGAVITLRTSGTEPKLKYYCEMNAIYPHSPKEELLILVNAMIETFIEPDKNMLKFLSCEYQLKQH